MDDIIIKNDGYLKEKDQIILHFTYDENLTLKEFSELLDLSNKAINSFNKSNGIKSNSKLGKEYASEVKMVKHGSIILEILISCAVTVPFSVLGNYIYDKMKKIGTNKKQLDNNNCKYPIKLEINNNHFDIHIYNKKDSNEV